MVANLQFLIQILKMICGTLIVLFLPGFFLSFVFFPLFDHIEETFTNTARGNQRGLDPIERLTFAILLSILLSSLTVYIVSHTTNHRPEQFINTKALYLTLIFITIVSGALAWFKLKSKKSLDPIVY